MPRKDVMRPIKPAEEIKNGSITVATSEASFQSVDPDVNQYTPSGEIVSGNRDRFDNINYYEQDGKLIPIVGQTPAAAYSLRALSGRSNASVVRLRRASDDAEKDFNAREVVPGTAGSELVVNGDFATDSVWSKGTGWSITGGQAVCDGSQISRSFLIQNGIYEDGNYLKVTFDIVACSDFNNAGLFVSPSSLSYFDKRDITSPGTYSLIFDRINFTGTANFRAFAEPGVTLTIDNMSCKYYTPSAAELWALEGILIQGSRLLDESAYATTWYDQSGNGNDATQSTSTAQPLLIRAGVTHVVNGKAALDFDGADDYLETQSFNSSQPISVFTVQRFDAAGDGANTYLLATNGNDVNIIANFVNRYQISAGSNCRADGSLYSNDQELFSVMFDSVNSNLYINGLDGQLDSNDAGVNGLTAPIRIGGSNVAPANGMLGEIQEVIFYPTDQTTNRTKIEKSINDYYNIYAYPDKPLISDVNPATSAAYSLRNLTDYPTETPVVRVRRGSDDAERDLKPMDIVAGTAGSELVTNGGFATDSDWTKGTGWSITGGQAVNDGSNADRQYLTQNSVMIFGGNFNVGDYYILEFTIVSAGSLTNTGMLVNTAGVQSFSTLGITSTGTYKILGRYGEANFSNVFRFWTINNTALTIDNVSCKPYTPSTTEVWASELDNNFKASQTTDSAYATAWYDQAASNEQVFPDTTLQTPANFATTGNIDTSTPGAFTITATEYSEINSTPLPDFAEVGKVYKVEFDYYTDNTANGFWARGLGQNAAGNHLPASTTPTTAYFIWECLPSPNLAPNLVAVQTSGSYNGTTLTWTGVRVTEVGNPATQSASTAQPLLIRAGLTNVENGKAALEFDGTDDYLDLAGVEFTSTLDELAVFTVSQTDDTAASQICLHASFETPGAKRIYVPRVSGGNLGTSYVADLSMSDGTADTDQHLVSLIVDKGDSLARSFNDGVAFSADATETISTTPTVNTSNNIGSFAGSSGWWNGGIQEIIIYPSDQSANRTNIETKINNNYNIF